MFLIINGSYTLVVAVLTTLNDNVNLIRYASGAKQFLFYLIGLALYIIFFENEENVYNDSRFTVNLETMEAFGLMFLALYCPDFNKKTMQLVTQDQNLSEKIIYDYHRDYSVFLLVLLLPACILVHDE